jgi:hypothetical protein
MARRVIGGRGDSQERALEDPCREGRYFSDNPGWQETVVPRGTVIFEGSAHPGRRRHPWKLELVAGRASSRTTVPVRKKLVHAPDPLPFVIVQLMPAGCEVTVPLPFPPGTIATLPCE